MATTGERIKEWRRKRGMTQSDLGEKVGLSATAIMRYEKNAREPKIPVFRAIADALQVSEQYLLCQSDDPNPSFTDFAFQLSWKEAEIDIEKLQRRAEELRTETAARNSQIDTENLQCAIDAAVKRHIDVLLSICSSPSVRPDSVPARIAVATKIIENSKWLIDGAGGGTIN